MKAAGPGRCAGQSGRELAVALRGLPDRTHRRLEPGGELAGNLTPPDGYSKTK